MPTYKEQYDKIIQAYFNDKIRPFDGKFCFCGTLNNGNLSWVGTEGVDPPNDNYTFDEYGEMERALYAGLLQVGVILLRPRIKGCSTNNVSNYEGCGNHPNYEDALFEGMSAALDVLKDIHEKRGENVDVIETQFVKRKLETV